MSESKTPIPAWNPWKYATLGILIVLATALITGVVVAKYVGNHSTAADLNPPPEAADAPAGQPQAAPTNAAPPPPPPANWAPNAPRSSANPAQKSGSQYASARPSKSDIERCNRYASEARNHTGQTLTDTLFGGALGAGLGAASGAIAGGGGGAGKGAGIGGLVGAAAGTLYGLNQANQEDKHSVAAYRACMRRHGYVD